MAERMRFKLNGLITVEQLAAQLNVSCHTVRSWIYLRRMSFTRLGNRVYFSVDAIEELLSQNAVAALRKDSSPTPRPSGQGGADQKENKS